MISPQRPQRFRAPESEGQSPGGAALRRRRAGKAALCAAAYGTERTMDLNELTSKVIEAAGEVHSHLGPGLLESIYEECLAHELHLHGVASKRQEPLPLFYKGRKLDCGSRLDLWVSAVLF